MISGILAAVGGLAVLAVAADQFVKGSARLAVLFRVSPVVVGAVIIGFGTSAPEMVVSAIASRNGDLDIGVGNVIGSNVANISLVLAAATLVTVIPVSRRILFREAPLSVASVILFAVLIQNGITRGEGLILLVVLALALTWILVSNRGEEPHEESVAELVGEAQISVASEVMRTLGSLVVVVASASLLVHGAESIAGELDLSGGFVGFTLVAMGTSAPELVTAVAAARRRETELLIGNLLGSNLFNSLAVGGVIGIVGPGQIQDATLAGEGALLMILVSAGSWMMMFGKGINRPKAAFLAAIWLVTAVLLSGGESALAAVATGQPFG